MGEYEKNERCVAKVVQDNVIDTSDSYHPVCTGMTHIAVKNTTISKMPVPKKVK